MSAPLGVCIIGAGKMGQLHLESWQTVPQVRVVAVADVAAARAEALAATADCAWHTDYRAAIDQPAVRIVSVCTPTNLHPEITVFAAERGKHILCEKPIALTLADADRMIEAAQRHGVTLGIGLMRRFSAVLPLVRHWLESGRLGRPVMYHSTSLIEIRPKRAMHNAQANGGPVIDMAVHYFDSWAYLFDGLPVQVSAQGLKLAQDCPELAHVAELAYDTAAITARYPSGDVGSYVVSWGLPPGTEGVHLPDQILCPNGLVQLSTHWGRQEARVSWHGQPWQPIAAPGDMYHRQAAHFAGCVISGQPPRVTGETGRAALQTALAALESIDPGQRQ